MAAPRQKYSSGTSDAMLSDEQVTCWCCKALIVVPVVEGVPAEVFKGFCLLIVAFTSGLIGSIGIFGVYPVLYSVCSSRAMFALNASFAFFLEANIFFNYYTAVFRNAGRVTDFYNLRLVPPARNSFEDFTFCEKCDKPKPPNTHHCSVCNACVVEMDHHCPYINNCVGRGNLRHFLLFLFWVTVAMLYALPVMAVCVYAHKGQITTALAYGKSLRRHRRDAVMAPFSLVLAFASMPTTPFVALLLAVICLMVLIMVGMLCARHWVLAAQGSTYVGRLKGEKVAEGGVLHNLQYVFGSAHPAFWLLPSLQEAHECAKEQKGA